MKNSSFIIIVLAVFQCQFMLSQQWCVPGAAWNYTFDAMPIGNIHGYTEVRYTGDTMMNGKLCNKLWYQRHEQNYTPVFPPAHSYYHYMYTTCTNSVVYYKTGTQSFDTLVNFNAIPGNYWRFKKMPIMCSNDTVQRFWLTVTDTGHSTINGSWLKYINLWPDAIPHPFNFSNPNATILVYERIGPVDDFLYPQFSTCPTNTDDWDYEGIFTCYWDEDMGLYAKNSGGCNYNPTGLNENQHLPDLHIYPNPSSGLFTLSDAGDGIVRIYNASGTLLKTINLAGHSEELDLRAYPDGFYILHLQSEDKSAAFRLIKN